MSCGAGVRGEELGGGRVVGDGEGRRVRGEELGGGRVVGDGEGRRVRGREGDAKQTNSGGG